MARLRRGPGVLTGMAANHPGIVRIPGRLVIAKPAVIKLSEAIRSTFRFEIPANALTGGGE